MRLRPWFSIFGLFVLFFATFDVCIAKDWSVSVGGQTTYDDGYGGTYSTANLVFSPASLTINVGDTVTFHGHGSGAHNVHADDNSFRCANGCDDSGGNGTPSADSWESTVTFGAPGVVKYHCDNHVSMGMVGTITVNSVAGAPAPITGATSGSWYDPDQSGHGFSIQVAPPNTFLFYWFTFNPDGGQQSWLLGAGAYDPTSNTVTVEAAQSTGTKFPPNFNHAEITTVDWGSVTFTFTDCTHGTVSWVSKIAGYGSGTLPLTKIVGVDGATCTN